MVYPEAKFFNHSVLHVFNLRKVKVRNAKRWNLKLKMNMYCNLTGRAEGRW